MTQKTIICNNCEIIPNINHILRMFETNLTIEELSIGQVTGDQEPIYKSRSKDAFLMKMNTNSSLEHSDDEFAFNKQTHENNKIILDNSTYIKNPFAIHHLDNVNLITKSEAFHLDSSENKLPNSEVIMKNLFNLYKQVNTKLCTSTLALDEVTDKIKQDVIKNSVSPSKQVNTVPFDILGDSYQKANQHYRKYHQN